MTVSYYSFKLVRGGVISQAWLLSPKTSRAAKEDQNGYLKTTIRTLCLHRYSTPSMEDSSQPSHLCTFPNNFSQLLCVIMMMEG